MKFLNIYMFVKRKILVCERHSILFLENLIDHYRKMRERERNAVSIGYLVILFEIFFFLDFEHFQQISMMEEFVYFFRHFQKISMMENSCVVYSGLEIGRTRTV